MTILALAGFIVFIDQITKILVYRSFYPGESLVVIKSIFHITLVLNSGAAFGLFQRGGSFFIAISAVVIIVILSVAFDDIKKARRRPLLRRLGLAFVLGGAASNLIDRLRLGHVIDFLDFRIWPVFNIADSAITIGCILLVLSFIISHASDTF